MWCVRDADTFLEWRVKSLELRCGVSAMRTRLIQYDVGRGDLTPPGNLAVAEKRPERSRPFPTNCREASNYRQNACFRQVCRGRIYASRAVYPLGCIAGVAATGGIYAAPTEYPQYCTTRKFPPHQSPAVTASPRGGSLSGAVGSYRRSRKTGAGGRGVKKCVLTIF